MITSEKETANIISAKPSARAHFEIKALHIFLALSICGFFSPCLAEEKNEFIDLELATAALTSNAFDQEKEISFICEVKNLGHIAANASVVAVQIDNQSPIKVSTVNFPPYSVKTLPLSFKPSPQLGLGPHKIKVEIKPSIAQEGLELESRRKNNSLPEIEFTIIKKEKPVVKPVSPQEVVRQVKALYAKFNRAYNQANFQNTLSCIDNDWEGPDSQTFVDLEHRLRKIFYKFNRLKMNIVDLDIQPLDNSQYIAKVSYALTIDARLRTDPKTTHQEASKVVEYIRQRDNKYLIAKTME